MTNQIFKNNVPNNLLFDTLDKICLKTDKYYLIDINYFIINIFIINFFISLNNYV